MNAERARMLSNKHSINNKEFIQEYHKIIGLINQTALLGCFLCRVPYYQMNVYCINRLSEDGFKLLNSIDMDVCIISWA